MMHKQLLKDISERITLSEQDILLSKEYFEPILVPKKRIIEEVDKIPQYLYYMVSGYMRFYYDNDNGDEVTTHINCLHRFFTPFLHFVNQTKSDVNVEAITNCQLLRISKLNYDLLMKQSQVWKDYSIIMLQESMHYNEIRSKELATLSAKQRYHQLLNTHPEIIQNVPLQYISSFLGIKPESLSRLRKNVD